MIADKSPLFSLLNVDDKKMNLPVASLKNETGERVYGEVARPRHRTGGWAYCH
jgi:hypothetical protein